MITKFLICAVGLLLLMKSEGDALLHSPPPLYAQTLPTEDALCLSWFYTEPETVERFDLYIENFCIYQCPAQPNKKKYNILITTKEASANDLQNLQKITVCPVPQKKYEIDN